MAEIRSKALNIMAGNIDFFFIEDCSCPSIKEIQETSIISTAPIQARFLDMIELKQIRKHLTPDGPAVWQRFVLAIAMAWLKSRRNSGKIF